MSATKMPFTRTEFSSMLGEGFHTAFRKGTEAPKSSTIWRLIADMEPQDWDSVIEYVVWGFEVTYNAKWKPESS